MMSTLRELGPLTARVTELWSLSASSGGSWTCMAVAMTTSFLIILEHSADMRSCPQSHFVEVCLTPTAPRD